jgi:hypothetical protein
MKLPHNCEPLFCRAGYYKIWDGDGHIWHATKHGSKNWYARPAPSHPALMTAAARQAESLTQLAHSLAARHAPKIKADELF